jgi:hypothetical protein
MVGEGGVERGREREREKKVILSHFESRTKNDNNPRRCVQYSDCTVLIYCVQEIKQRHAVSCPSVD